ncbi:MAG: matrixin family metalloprotease [Planctomycetota bacterium]
MRRFRTPSLCVATLATALLLPATATAFVSAGSNASTSRWLSTASGSAGVPGDPLTLTWSFLPDGTELFNPTVDPNNPDPGVSFFLPSDLLSRLDSEFGSGAGPGGGDDLTTRPWFSIFEDSFDRWTELTGVTFVYEPNDDGRRHNSADGVLGVRGDLRIGGAGFDGSGGTLAYNYFSFDGGDMGIDTDDFIDLLANPADDFRYLRNTIMHETGHGLGLDHIVSNDADFLLEPTINVGFDGPQHDDLRGIHWLYGDAFEKGVARNEIAPLATPLGDLAVGGSLSIGAGGTGAVVDLGETDFVSISNENDTDFFSFTIDSPISLDAVMTPRGATYNQGSFFDTTRTSDLELAIFDADGVSVLAESASGAAGVAEGVAGVALAQPGVYYARVQSQSDTADQIVQFYQLDVSATSLGPALPGDFDGSGLVDLVDYTLWRDTLGQTVPRFTAADHNGDGSIGLADYDLWVANFGQTLGGGSAVPEPGGLLASAVLAACPAANVGRRRRRV